MADNLVIVESPAKANTIEKILGKDFKVVSSYGHIRDLAKKNMGIDIANSFQPQYQVSEDKKTVLRSLIKESKKSSVIWLATDEDREGEAIAWHLYEAMNLSVKKVHRIVFHEITSTAIKAAITKPRDIDIDLVNAQQARRILDRIVGFKLSPILWKKVRTGLSAGRVQSVAVRLIVEKEKSIKQFVPTKSYVVSAEFIANNEPFNSILIDKFDKKSEARDLLESFIGSDFIVDFIETKPSKSSPSPPFTTSSLQQGASNRLGFSVSRTMSTAQKLYEAGFITYMRTDSTALSNDAVSNMEKYIIGNYGDKYLEKRKYTTKAKVAQEAHEAIRPTDIYKLNCGADDSQKKLYKLIWERSICSQMSNAIFDKTNMNIISNNKHGSVFQSKGQMIKFDGYLRAQHDTPNGSKKDKLLPNLKLGDKVVSRVINANEKYTKSPSRFTEASLVKKMEDLGIGRPSTYAPTISVIQKRAYVVKEDVLGVEKAHVHLMLTEGQISELVIQDFIGAEKKKLLPTEIGTITSDFLVENFNDILDYNFTAKVESQFDDIACGKEIWQDMLSNFYKDFEPQVLTVDKNSGKVTGIRALGVDPDTGKNVYVRLGKYGPIAQIGESEEGKEKPKYASLKKGQTIEGVDLSMALKLFDLPRNLGPFEDEEVIVSEGRYGPYIRHNKVFTSLSEGDDPFTIEINRCIELILEKRKLEKQKLINSFEYKELPIEILNGRYGPYIKYKKKNYKIPKTLDPKNMTQSDCVTLIEKK